MVETPRLQAKSDWRDASDANVSRILPLPPGEAAAERRVRDSGVSEIAVPSSPALLDSGSGLRPTSSIPGVVPEGEGVQV